MKVFYNLTAFFLTLSCVTGFQAPATFHTTLTSLSTPPDVYRHKTPSALNFFTFGKNDEEEVIAVEDKNEPFGWTDFGNSASSYVFTGSWVALVIFAFFLAPGDINSASDKAMLDSIIANPAAPDINPFYFGVFNLFTALPVALFCMICPRASKEGPPAVPFVTAASFIGYFAMGPYLALRKEPLTDIAEPSSQLGWATRNILENKLFNVSTLLFGLYAVGVAILPGLDDPVSNWNGLLDVLQSSKFASVSAADLFILNLVLAKEAADDYKTRCAPNDVEKSNLIGASTALLPIIGSLIYCVLRPSYEYEEA